MTTSPDPLFDSSLITMGTVKAFLKSLGAALVGTGLFFAFFAMLCVPVLTVITRLRDPNAPLEAPDVLLSMTPVYRYIGLPLSGVAFLIVFLLAIKKFRKQEERT